MRFEEMLDAFGKVDRQTYRDELGDWLAAQLRRYSYKPGWVFDVLRREYGGEWSVRITFMAVDSRHSGQTIKISGLYQMPFYWGDMPTSEREVEFGRWLAYTILSAEEHESREWLRRDGEILDDPHKRA